MAKVGSFRFYLVLAIALIIFLPPFAKYQELGYKNRKLSSDMRELKKEIAALQIEKKRLETDITYIESKARQNIGVVRKGEIVIKDTASQKKR